MHEFSITRSMLDQALCEAEKHGARRINRIRLLLGEDGGVVPDCVRFYFDEMKKGTAAAAAVLEFKAVPLRIRCPKCGAEWGPSLPKPAQGSATALTPPSLCQGERTKGGGGEARRSGHEWKTRGAGHDRNRLGDSGSCPKPGPKGQGDDSRSELGASLFDGMCDCNAGGEVVSGQELVIESIDVD